MTTLAQLTTAVAAVGSGIIGGVFFAFSVVVMPALRHAPTPVGVRSMQAINRAAVHPPLMIALFGTAIVCVGLIVWAIRSWIRTVRPLRMRGSSSYRRGPRGITCAGLVAPQACAMFIVALLQARHR